MTTFNNRFNMQFFILAGCTLLVAYLALVPLAMLLYNSLMSAPPGVPGAIFTLRHYARAYLDPEFFSLWKNTIAFGMWTCLATFVLGTGLAWIYERTNTPFKKIFAVMALVPFIIPGMLSTIAWILLLSPDIGIFNIVLKNLLHLETAPLNVFSMAGMVWTQSMHNYPLVFLMMASAFRSMDMALEEASTLSGAGTFQTFYLVTLPLMRPAVLSAILIMFIRTIEGFSVPAIIGLPAGIEVFTAKIYMALHQYPTDFGLASSLAVSLLLITIIGVFAYRKFTRQEERFVTVTGKGYRPRMIDLGPAKYVLSGCCMAFFTITIAVPLLIILWSSFVPFYEIPSLEGLARFSWKNYVYIFKFPMAVRAFRNSIFLMVGTATLTMLLTSIMAWITVKSKIKGKAMLDAVIFVPIALPGIVLGVSLIYVYLTLPLGIYGTIWILLIAYITKMMPYGLRTTTASIMQIHRELEEASALSGASWGITFRKITLPLLISGFMAGWLYIAMVSLRELATSILLYSQGTEVLSIVVFDLWEGGKYPALCAIGIVMTLMLVLLALVADKVGSKIGIKRIA